MRHTPAEFLPVNQLWEAQEPCQSTAGNHAFSCLLLHAPIATYRMKATFEHMSLHHQECMGSVSRRLVHDKSLLLLIVYLSAASYCLLALTGCWMASIIILVQDLTSETKHPGQGPEIYLDAFAAQHVCASSAPWHQQIEVKLGSIKFPNAEQECKIH